MTLKMKRLMNRPEEKCLTGKAKNLFFGKDLEDYVTNSIYDDWCKFVFVEKGVKENIEKDKVYKVWYEYFDASNPMDSSCSYSIHYIEEAPEEIREAVIMSKTYEKMMREYLEKE
jgi:hypothetical protein